jgi:hypothetical protein
MKKLKDSDQTIKANRIKNEIKKYVNIKNR